MHLVRVLASVAFWAIPTLATPIRIESGLLPLETIGAFLYRDTPPVCGAQSGFGEGAFGSLAGVPSNCIAISGLTFVGNPGALVDGPLSNLVADSLGFHRDDSHGGNFNITWRDSRNDPARVDTVLRVEPFYFQGVCVYCVFSLGFKPLALSIRSEQPLIVTYGTGRGAPTLAWDYTLRLTSTTDGSGMGGAARYLTDSSGELNYSSGLSIESAEVAFSNPTLGTITWSTRLSSHAGGSEWRVVPEPGSIGLMIAGGILLFGPKRARQGALVRFCRRTAETGH
jgi:hypothetical protein